jgi:hypothetical protein
MESSCLNQSSSYPKDCSAPQVPPIFLIMTHTLLGDKKSKSLHEPFVVSTYGPTIKSELWFKTKPVDINFVRRATRLQLLTDSHDQGAVSDVGKGAWTWFELCILEDERATEPLVVDGKRLSWRSHVNHLDPEADSHEYGFKPEDRKTRHFGTIFDRRQDILDALQVCLFSVLLEAIFSLNI